MCAAGAGGRCPRPSSSLALDGRMEYGYGYSFILTDLEGDHAAPLPAGTARKRDLPGLLTLAVRADLRDCPARSTARTPRVHEAPVFAPVASVIVEDPTAVGARFQPAPGPGGDRTEHLGHDISGGSRGVLEIQRARSRQCTIALVTPAVETPVANRLDLGEIKPDAPPRGKRILTATAVFDGQHWSALCRELDIAADGLTPQDAIANLRSAVVEAIEVAAERGISPGAPAAERDVMEFLQTHRSLDPVMGQQFVV